MAERIFGFEHWEELLVLTRSRGNFFRKKLVEFLSIHVILLVLADFSTIYPTIILKQIFFGRIFERKSTLKTLFLSK